MKTISTSARVHDDAPLPEYEIGDRVYDAWEEMEATVIGVIYWCKQDFKPAWCYMIVFDAGETRQATEDDLSYPDEPDV